MERPRWLVALALGTTAVFDLTGAVVYRVMRGSLPPPPSPGGAAIQEAARELADARREAVNRARARDGVTFPT